MGIDAIRPEKPAVLMLIAAVLSVSACAGPDRAPDVAPVSVPVPDVRSVPPAAHPEGSPTDCRRWLAEDGDDDAVGSEEEPWATLQHALESIPETGCNVEVLPGTYAGARIDRHYTGTAVIRSAQPYLAVLEGDTTVLDVQGAFNVAIEGFEIRQVGPESTGVIVNIEEANGVEATWIEVRDNIIHDSFDDDLLKIRDAARHVSISGNVFYNQASGEQHIDINGVHDITVEDNIFSNDFGASGRKDRDDTKAFIVVKDSSATGDLGSRRVTLRRNVFLNWQGGRETLIQIGNDGKEYFEAIEVTVENNLILGNSPSYATAAFGAAGVANVRIRHNTVVGDFPSGAFAARFDQKGDNLPNQGIDLRNNIFADPTGTMGDFTNGVPHGLTLDTNLYWNDGRRLDTDGPVNPPDDPGALMSDPRLNYDHTRLSGVIWDGAGFSGETRRVRDEFVRLVETYAVLPAGSPAIDAADPEFSPTDDILGRTRDPSPDMGAFESSG